MNLLKVKPVLRANVSDEFLLQIGDLISLSHSGIVDDNLEAGGYAYIAVISEVGLVHFRHASILF